MFFLWQIGLFSCQIILFLNRTYFKKMETFQHIHQYNDYNIALVFDLFIVLLLPCSWVGERGGVERDASRFGSDEVRPEIGIRGINTCNKEQYYGLIISSIELFHISK